MISTDTFIEIGSQHKVCEDYIVSGDSPVPFIILADGCSKSNDSEMGARILCHLAKQYITYNGVDSEESHKYSINLGNWVIHNAEMVARQMGLKKSCLDATLVIGYVVGNMFFGHLFGDGFMIMETRDHGTIRYELRWVDYSQNAPYYLTYLIDNERAKLYHDMKIEKTLNYLAIMKDASSFDVEPISQAYDSSLTFIHSMEDFHKILICSDGISSFLDPNVDINSNKLIEVPNLLPELFAFKSTKGEFLKRRCNKYMKKLNKAGINHFDDLSIGAFLYEDENNGAET